MVQDEKDIKVFSQQGSVHVFSYKFFIDAIVCFVEI